MAEDEDVGDWSGVSGVGTAEAPAGTGSVEVKGNGLPAVRLKTFKGSKDEYENWKREIETIKVLYGLPDERLAPMMYLALEDSRGGPRELFKHVPISEICSASGLKLLWQILDKEFERLPVQRADKAQQRFERARRRPFQSMDLYLRELRASLREFQADDPDSTISDLFLARKMLRNSGLSQSEQRSTLAAAGCKWQSAEIEQALLLMFPDAHVQDRSRLGTMRGQGQRPSHAGRAPWKSGKGKGGKGEKSKGTYVADTEVEAEVSIPDGTEDALASHVGDAHIFEEEDLLLLDDDEEEEEPEADEEESVYEEEELLEVYYQGQKAKHKLSKMKGRGRGDTRSIEEKKKGSKCGSCGQLGHWRGDASCPNVRSGKEKPFQKKSAGTSTGAASSTPPYGAHAVFVAHDVLMVGGSADWHIPDDDIAADGVQVDGFTFHRSTQTDPVPGLQTLQALKAGAGKGAAVAASASIGPDVPEDLTDIQLERFTVVQLKRWLKQHGLPVSGKKDDLVTRVYEHWCEQSEMTDGVTCEHASTVSGGNASYSWRKCRHCKRMLYRVDKASGLEEHFAGTQEVVEFAEGKVIQSVDKNSFAVLFASKPKKLLCIPDSGCRRNVAGRDWHQKLQRQLNVQGLCGIYKPEREKFRFGDSRVEESEGSWLYPVKKANQLMVFNVACVNTDCPPLLSVSSMASLGVVINFVDNEIELRGLGTTVDMQHVASGHPVLEFDVPEVTDDVPTAFTCLQEQAVSALGVSWEMPDSQEVQVLHSELVQCEHAKLLELLQNITIPPNRSRSKKLTGSDQVVVEHPPRSMLLGLYTKQG
eukprot:6490390-Amphidinium_carterae.1